ncbi:hypothetical protein P7C71_g4018, partial [Lecanoromycetidae sp. Uapishka_2]
MAAKKGLALQRAIVDTLATDERLTSGNLSDVAKEAMQRILRCRARTAERGATWLEAQNATRIWQKIMAQHNIDMADVLKEEDPDERAKRGGLSTVIIQPARDGAPIIFQTWTMDLVVAMNEAFNCKAFSVRSASSLKWTFYGLLENTAAAALAFEICHNLILDWSLRRRRSVAVRNSYCTGLAHGLRRRAIEENEEQERAAEEYEDCDAESKFEGFPEDNEETKANYTFVAADTELQAFQDDEIDVNFGDGDGSTDDEEGVADFDESTELSEPSKHRAQWKSVQQLVLFRDHAKEIAEAVLKEHNFKLSKGRKRKRSVRDKGEYTQGREDSKRINVKTVAKPRIDG